MMEQFRAVLLDFLRQRMDPDNVFTSLEPTLPSLPEVWLRSMSCCHVTVTCCHTGIGCRCSTAACNLVACCIGLVDSGWKC